MKTLLKTKTIYLTKEDALDEVLKRNPGYFESLAQAIYGLGIALAAECIKKGVAGKIIKVLGLSTSVDAVLKLLSKDGTEQARFMSAVKKLSDAPTGKRLKITTKYYLWQSGSLNHHAYIMENTYKIV